MVSGLREGLLSVGISPAEFDAYLAALDNPQVVIGSPVLISAWGATILTGPVGLCDFVTVTQ